MNIEELNELMKNAANDAIEYLKNVHHQRVTLSEEYLSIVDSVLAKLSLQHLQTPITDEHLFAVCNIFGAFVGEIYRKTLGGEWFQDTSNAEAPFIVLNYAGKSFPFASVCYEKITKSPEISVAKYYELAKSGSTQ